MRKFWLINLMLILQYVYSMVNSVIPNAMDPIFFHP